ncbi:regulatory LuxR family protein [Archangium gephyra]|uniref:Regulatory LuxR family protein n=1 Tax=Archangium gephyra TaxID=48 RepID=A0AAC8TEI2_9BACT|nr:helix-turn-helix transcriptional regulator [Archangium gephyra]AKJ02968.1 Transcriptional regulator, LuxR family protein [Archangium gephyra]REG25093.1 regulatory LuxR family protein [Archangium gephyra]
MKGTLKLNSREQALIFDLMEVLTSSLELPSVLSGSHDVLARLVPADYAALCVSRPGRTSEYDWMVAQMPRAFFEHYHEMAAEDFVRGAVVRKPGVVLRDSEMVPRQYLERSAFYRHCRELRMPLEHVMAVMLDVGRDCHGGFMLYRDRPRPFSDRQQALLQRLTPVLTGTVRNCRMLQEVAGRAQYLEALFRYQGAESIVLAPPSTEVMRTDHATTLVEKWFPPLERTSQGLPEVLVEHLKRLVGAHGIQKLGVPDTWECTRQEQRLKVTFVPLPEQSGRKLWALLLQEVSNMPSTWRELLTKREAEVVERVLQGWDNQLVAEDLGCKKATVKQHMKKIFDKLGVGSRAALISRAARR